MRRWLVGFSVVAVALGFGVVNAGGSGASTRTTPDVICGVTGTVDVSPGLTETPAPQEFTITATFSNILNCPDGATMSGKLSSPSAFCKGGSVQGEPAVGEVITKKLDKDSPLFFLSMTTAPAPHGGFLMQLSGKVKKGDFTRDKVLMRAAQSFTQSCPSVTEYGFATPGAPKTIPLTLSHK